jgi:AcrR family transcriptional regulator
MASKRDWLDAGLAILAEAGAPALTVEELCARLGLTKGSFYHHFRGMGGYKGDLLAHFETHDTTRYIDAAEQAGGDRLARLMDLVLEDTDAHAGLEPAVRAWASQDAEVRAVQARVDRARTDYLRELWLATGGAERDATAMARLLYLVLVGAEQVVPPISDGALREVYELALRPAPERGHR